MQGAPRVEKLLLDRAGPPEAEQGWLDGLDSYGQALDLCDKQVELIYANHFRLWQWRGSCCIGLGRSFTGLSITLFAGHEAVVLMWPEAIFLGGMVFPLYGLHPSQIQTTLPLICWYQNSSSTEGRARG